MPVVAYSRSTPYQSKRFIGSYISANYGPWNPYDVSSSTMNLGSETITGVRDSDWRIKVSKMQNASHPYTRTSFVKVIPFQVKASAEWIDSLKNRYRSRIDSSVPAGYNVLPNPSTAALVDRATARYRRRLSESAGNARLLIPLVELRELRSTINASVNLASDFVKTIATARKTRGRSFVTFFQSQWLNFSFGISPLVGDTLAAIDAIEKWFSTPTGLHRIRGSATQSSVFSQSADGLPGNLYGCKFTGRTLGSVRQDCHIVSGIDFDILSSNAYSLRQHLGLSEIGVQIPSLAWEIMPFSWVLDYFGTMGAYLEDLFYSPPGEAKYCTQTIKTVVKSQTSFELVRNLSNVTWLHTTLHEMKPAEIEHLSVSRVVLANTPARSLRFKTVDEIGLGALNKLLNLASILRG